MNDNPYRKKITGRSDEIGNGVFIVDTLNVRDRDVADVVAAIIGRVDETAKGKWQPLPPIKLTTNLLLIFQKHD